MPDGKDTSDYLLADDQALLACCEVHVYRSSGPGGQHRNKVSSAVRLVHRPTGIAGHGDESRSQQDNRRMAMRRLRMNIACKVRRGLDPAAGVPSAIAECLFLPKPSPGRRRQENAPAADEGKKKKLDVGVRDHRFWRVAGRVLDVLEAFGGSVADTGRLLGVSTGNVGSFLKSERHLLTAANEIRKRHALTPLT
ncbi:MAG: peptide chain release factor-like protein [Planctomycetota bacterium]|nr:peptide chain release factor-like protein [Planctomycetota bacterium]